MKKRKNRFSWLEDLLNNPNASVRTAAQLTARDIVAVFSFMLPKPKNKKGRTND